MIREWVLHQSKCYAAKMRAFSTEKFCYHFCFWFVFCGIPNSYKNYNVVRNSGWAHSRITWKLTLIFLINESMNGSSADKKCLKSLIMTDYGCSMCLTIEIVSLDTTHLTSQSWLEDSYIFAIKVLFFLAYWILIGFLKFWRLITLLSLYRSNKVLEWLVAIVLLFHQNYHSNPQSKFGHRIFWNSLIVQASNINKASLWSTIN